MVAEAAVAGHHLDALDCGPRRSTVARHGTMPSLREKMAVEGTARLDWSSCRRGRSPYRRRIMADG
jgi:hypothetical protein